MGNEPTQELFRLLPKVDELLRRPAFAALAKDLPRPVLLHAAQVSIEELREEVAVGRWNPERLERAANGEEIERRVKAAVQVFESSGVARAVNATGVVLHTGLGRAPMARAAVEAAAEAAGYALLEIDRASGERGQRDLGLERLLKLLLGCEAATAVNNNAAATMIAVNAFAKGKEVIVSRGELVEIGGSYRMPEVMKAGGAKLVEVGTTNRTRIGDYRAAIGKKAGLLLKVHTSNFRVEGFTEEASLAELAALGRETGIPFVHDLGSGLVLDTPLPGLESEPRVIGSLREGPDLVTFSGDKLLGGPQAGILVGKAEAVKRVRKNPLFRAFRLGKQSLAALEATLRIYLRGPVAAIAEIPTLSMLAMGKEELQRRAESLLRGIQSLGHAEISAEIVEEFSEVGSGSAPGVKLPTYAVALRHEKLKAAAFAKRLRMANPPVFSRIHDNRVLLDPRTLIAGDESRIIAALADQVQPGP